MFPWRSHGCFHAERLQSAEQHLVARSRKLSGNLAVSHGCEAGNKFIGSAAAAADDIHESLVDETAHCGSHCLNGLVVLSQFVGQSGVGINADKARCFSSQCAKEWHHVGCSKRAVESDGEDGVGRHRCKECLGSLSAQRATSFVADCYAEHDGQLSAFLLHHR